MRNRRAPAHAHNANSVRERLRAALGQLAGVFASGRAYTFTLDNTTVTTSDPSSRSIYDEMLRSITFQPQTADDRPIGAPTTP